MMEDEACPFAATRATYASAEGSRAFLAKEAPGQAARDLSAWGLLDGLDLAGARILDMGCGSGGDVAEMRRRGALAYGLDASPALLAEAQRRHGHPGWWLRGDLLSEAVPGPALAGLDVVWSMASLVHVPLGRTAEVLGRWASWLRPGGRIVLATKEGAGTALTYGLGPALPRAMAYRSLADVRACLEGLGLEVELARGGKPSADAATRDTLLLLRARRPA